MGWHGGRHPKAGRPDRERINVNERHELDYWSKGVLLARMETQMALGGIHRRRIDGVGKPAGTVFNTADQNLYNGSVQILRSF